MSLTKRLNNSGPSTLPCGTPEVTPTHGETPPRKRTRCLRPVKNDLTQCHNSPRTLNDVASFSSKVWCGIVSKAFDMSRKTASTLGGAAFIQGRWPGMHDVDQLGDTTSVLHKAMLIRVEEAKCAQLIINSSRYNALENFTKHRSKSNRSIVSN